MTGYWSRSLVWVRIGGYGLHIKNTRTHPLLFSEREGLRPRFQVGRWSIRLLRPADTGRW